MKKGKVIKVEPSEFSIKKAKKEAEKAERKGYKVAFDLTGIQDREMLREIIKYTAGIETSDDR